MTTLITRRRQSARPLTIHLHLICCDRLTRNVLARLAMVVFHHGLRSDELANGHSVARALHAAVGSPTLLCPLQHEDGCIDGQPSLAHRLWQLLDAAGASGLQADVLATRMQRCVDDVQTTLKSNKYFIHLSGGLQLGRNGSRAT